MLGNVYLTLKRNSQAMASFQQAVLRIEQLRDQVAGTEQDQVQYLEDKVVFYRELTYLHADHYTQTRKPLAATQALSYSEGIKGRIIVDAVVRGFTSLPDMMSAEDKQQYIRLAQEERNISFSADGKSTKRDGTDHIGDWLQLRQEFAFFTMPLAHSDSRKSLIYRHSKHSTCCLTAKPRW